MKLAATIALAVAMTASAASASLVTVTIKGVVEQNQVTAPPIGQFTVGQVATMTFTLDSDVFVNSAQFPTRGYVITQPSFSLSVGAATIGLKSPFPAGQTPYFVLRNNDPAVDGFFVSTDVGFPVGVPLNQQGIFGPFSDNFSVTYAGNTLSSLNILDALGTYEFNGLQVFNWTIDDGPFSPVIIDFTSLTIAAVPGPGGLAVLGLALAGPRRRRH